MPDVGQSGVTDEMLRRAQREAFVMGFNIPDWRMKRVLTAALAAVGANDEQPTSDATERGQA